LRENAELIMKYQVMIDKVKLPSHYSLRDEQKTRISFMIKSLKPFETLIKGKIFRNPLVFIDLHPSEKYSIMID
jgi:hypothetical protein